MIALDVEDLREIAYRFGENLVTNVIVDGVEVLARTAPGPL